MKEYLYVNVYIGKMIGSELEAHRDIIDEKSQLGYRYAGWIPTKMSDYGKILSLDLVFERDRREDAAESW